MDASSTTRDGGSPDTAERAGCGPHGRGPARRRVRWVESRPWAVAAAVAAVTLLVAGAERAAAVGGRDYAVFRLTDNVWQEGRPAAASAEPLGVGGGWVVWAAPSAAGGDTEIMRYDLATRVTTVLTGDSAPDMDPVVTGRGDVVWVKGLGPEAEVFAYLASTTFILRITKNLVEDGEVSAAGDLVAYVRKDPAATKPGQVVLFNLVTRTGLLLASDSRRDDSPHTDGQWVAWRGWDATDPEIYLYDGSTVIRLTDNDVEELSPVVCGGAVTWAGWDGHDFEIYRWEGGAITQLTDNDVDDMEPACAAGAGGDFVAWGQLTTPRRLLVAARRPGVGSFYTVVAGEMCGDRPRLALSPWGVAWVAPRGGSLMEGDVVYRDHEGWVSTITDDPAPDSWCALAGDVVAWLKGTGAGAEVWLARPDMAFPEVTLEAPLPGAVLGGSPGGAALIHGTATDDLAVASVRISTDGGATWHAAVFDAGAGTTFATWHWDWPLPPEDYVPHEVQVEVRDVAGRTFIPAAGTRTVYVDTVAPHLVSLLLNGGAATSFAETVMVKLVVEDGSPEVEVSLRNAGGAWDGRRERPREFPWALAPGLGLRALEVEACDAAGNVGGPWPASITVEQGPFRDVTPGHDYALPIYALQGAGLIHGYEIPGGWEFRPENRLWRAQFAKMICGVLGVAVTEDLTSPFRDLGPDDLADLYPHEYVAAAYAAGITVGTGPTAFSPWTEITRAQLVTMAVRAAQGRAPGALAEPPAEWPGTLGAFDATHGPTMRIAEYNGLLGGVVGFGAGWDPWAPASRGEAAEVLFRMWWMLGP